MFYRDMFCPPYVIVNSRMNMRNNNNDVDKYVDLD